MPTQISLDLRGDGLATLWKRLPEPQRLEVIAAWARLIADAAQWMAKAGKEKRKGAHR
jgi:hypothetical protein